MYVHYDLLCRRPNDSGLVRPLGVEVGVARGVFVVRLVKRKFPWCY